MFRHRGVFEADYLPETVRHRNSELSVVANSVQMLTDMRHVPPVFCHGNSGTGKTASARTVCRRLTDEHPEIATKRINCWEVRSRFEVLYRALEAAGGATDITRQSTAADVVHDHLRDTVREQPLILVLDEVDQLQHPDVLYELLTMENVALICIALSENEFLAGLDQRIAEKFRAGQTVEFRQYELEELVDILSDRAEVGLKPGVVCDAQFVRIADRAAGNAHAALNTLMHAADISERAGHDQVRTDVLDEAEDAARKHRQQAHIGRLDEHQTALFEIVDEGGELQMGDLYERYCERVDQPLGERSVRRHLNRLAEYNLIRAPGRTRDRVYRAVSYLPSVADAPA